METQAIKTMYGNADARKISVPKISTPFKNNKSAKRRPKCHHSLFLLVRIETRSEVIIPRWNKKERKS